MIFFLLSYCSDEKKQKLRFSGSQENRCSEQITYMLNSKDWMYFSKTSQENN